MKVNATKTQMLVLGTPAMLRNLPPVTVCFCGSVVVDAGTVKNLGLYLDRHLNYQAHISAITSKCTGILIGLSHARHVIPANTLKAIVQALVRYIDRTILHERVRILWSDSGPCAENPELLRAGRFSYIT